MSTTPPKAPANDGELKSGYDSVAMLVVSSVFICITWVTVILRFYTRQFIVKSVGWDDWLILLTTVNTLYESQSHVAFSLTVIITGGLYRFLYWHYLDRKA